MFNKKITNIKRFLCLMQAYGIINQRMGDKVEIIGILNGYDGLINGNYRVMAPDEFSGILTVGGTILCTKQVTSVPKISLSIVLGRPMMFRPSWLSRFAVFVGAVAAQAEQAVQLGVLVGLFHGGNLVHIVIAHNAHHLERGALGAKNRAAYRQNRKACSARRV